VKTRQERHEEVAEIRECWQESKMLVLFATVTLFAGLAVLTVVDAKTRRLPDTVTLPLIGLGLIFNFWIYSHWIAPLIGAVLGYGSMVALEVGYRRLRGRDGLGRGDAKLFAAGGAWCSAWLLPQISLIAATSALVFVALASLVKKQPVTGNVSIAFGPWLALGIAVCWLFRAYGPAELLLP
jgi:leader peptidase (prepilin peptidase)/N-methyltransferase